MMMIMMSMKPFRHHYTNYTNVKYLDRLQIFNICQYLVKLPFRKHTTIGEKFLVGKSRGQRVLSPDGLKEV